MDIEKLIEAYKSKKCVTLYYNNNYVATINFKHNTYCEIGKYTIYVYVKKTKQYGFLGLRLIVNFDTFVINN